MKGEKVRNRKRTNNCPPPLHCQPLRPLPIIRIPSHFILEGGLKRAPNILVTEAPQAETPCYLTILLRNGFSGFDQCAEGVEADEEISGRGRHSGKGLERRR